MKNIELGDSFLGFIPNLTEKRKITDQRAAATLETNESYARWLSSDTELSKTMFNRKEHVVRLMFTDDYGLTEDDKKFGLEITQELYSRKTGAPLPKPKNIYNVYNRKVLRTEYDFAQYLNENFTDLEEIHEYAQAENIKIQSIVSEKEARLQRENELVHFRKQAERDEQEQKFMSAVERGKQLLENHPFIKDVANEIVENLPGDILEKLPSKPWRDYGNASGFVHKVFSSTYFQSLFSSKEYFSSSLVATADYMNYAKERFGSVAEAGRKEPQGYALRRIIGDLAEIDYDNIPTREVIEHQAGDLYERIINGSREGDSKAISLEPGAQLAEQQLIKEKESNTMEDQRLPNHYYRIARNDENERGKVREYKGDIITEALINELDQVDNQLHEQNQWGDFVCDEILNEKVVNRVRIELGSGLHLYNNLRELTVSETAAKKLGIQGFQDQLGRWQWDFDKIAEEIFERRDVNGTGWTDKELFMTEDGDYDTNEAFLCFVSDIHDAKYEFAPLDDEVKIDAFLQQEEKYFYNSRDEYQAEYTEQVVNKFLSMYDIAIEKDKALQLQQEEKQLTQDEDFVGNARMRFIEEFRDLGQMKMADKLIQSPHELFKFEQDFPEIEFLNGLSSTEKATLIYFADEKDGHTIFATVKNTDFDERMAREIGLGVVSFKELENTIKDREQPMNIEQTKLFHNLTDVTPEITEKTKETVLGNTQPITEEEADRAFEDDRVRQAVRGDIQAIQASNDTEIDNNQNFKDIAVRYLEETTGKKAFEDDEYKHFGQFTDERFTILHGNDVRDSYQSEVVTVLNQFFNQEISQVEVEKMINGYVKDSNDSQKERFDEEERLLNEREESALQIAEDMGIAEVENQLQKDAEKAEPFSTLQEVLDDLDNHPELVPEVTELEKSLTDVSRYDGVDKDSLAIGMLQSKMGLGSLEPEHNGVSEKQVSPKTLDKPKNTSSDLAEQALELIKDYSKNPEDMAEYLEFMAKFPKLSANNVALIHKQWLGANAVATFDQWKDRGKELGLKAEDVDVVTRTITDKKTGESKQLTLDTVSVRAGEKSQIQLIGMNSQRYFEKERDGKPQRHFEKYWSAEEKQKVASGAIEAKKYNKFYPYKVFEISQTNIKPDSMPKALPNRHVNFDVEPELAKAMRDGLVIYATNIGVPVSQTKNGEFNPLGNAKGVFSPSDNKITMNHLNTPSEDIPTLIHELTHATLHKNASNDRREYARGELEAEMTSFVVSSHYGIDTKAEAIPYIAQWTNNAKKFDDKELNQSLSKVTKTAKTMIATIDANLDPKIKKIQKIAKVKEKTVQQAPKVQVKPVAMQLGR